MTQGDEDAVPLVLELRAYVRCVEEKQLDGLKGVAALMAQAADAIEALSIPQGLGEGLVLVPREPTQDMIDAGVEHFHTTSPQFLDEECRDRYKAMIAALTSARAQ